MARKREPITVKVVPVEADEAEVNRVWNEVMKILAAAAAEMEAAPSEGEAEVPTEECEGLDT